MAQRIGTVTNIQSQGSNTNSVAAPAGAQALLVFAHGYDNGGTGLTSCSYNGVDVPILSQSNNATTGHVSVAALRNPAAGTNDFTWVWASTQEFGGQLFLVWLDEILDTAAFVSDSASALAESAANPGPLTLNTNADDWVGGIACSWPTPDPDAAVTGQTVFQESALFESIAAELAEVDSPGASTTDFAMTGFSFSHMAAIAIQNVAASGVSGTGTPAAQSAAAAGVGEVTKTGTGAAAAQSATAAGVAERIVSGTGTPAAQSAAVVGAGSVGAVRSVVLTAANNRELRDENNALVANLANIAWEWYDTPGNTLGNPDDSGTTSTDASGETTIQINNTALAAGQFGQLILYHPSDTQIRGTYRVPLS